jgi:hypothetical protein
MTTGSWNIRGLWASKEEKHLAINCEGEGGGYGGIGN